jgi:hypothetical protein
MRYAYPKVVTRNFGDYVIDYAVRKVLGKYFPPPAAECDTAVGTYPADGVACMLIPGITHLTAGTLPYPTYCLSGNIWQPMPPRGLLLRSRVVHARRRTTPDLTLARLVASPVGARDPYTYSLLADNGIPTIYTGCATLMLDAAGSGDDGYVLFSLGRGCIRTQTRAAHRLARKHNVIGICHETSDVENFRAAGWGLPLVTYRGDVELYLSYFKRASTIVTGRLHGALPGLAYGKRVFFYGRPDTRTTILDDLGVRIHDYSELGNSVDRASNAYNRALVVKFEENWRHLCALIAERCGARPGVLRSAGA